MPPTAAPGSVPAAEPPFPDWRVVIPVKGGSAAKSRLRPPGAVDRGLLATAIAQDCLVGACAGVPASRVTVVTASADVAGFAAALGCSALRDRGRGLNAAVRDGVRAAVGSQPGDAEVPVGVLLGDLPALTGVELRTALDASARHLRAFVPDAANTGTVLLAARDGRLLRPAFGAGSAAAHAALGHVRLDLALPGLRTDVDDAPSLAAAAGIGLGRHTRAALAAPPLPGSTLPGMQATVRAFDPDTGAGSALLDDGTAVTFSGEVFAVSALRHLRPGQRLSVDLAADGRTVDRLWIRGIGEGEAIG